MDFTRFDDDVQFAPPIHRNSAPTPEHWARYGWASTLAAGADVLDVGCGLGWGAAMLAESAKRVTGVDISAQAVTSATDRHGDRGHFLEASMQELPFDDESFDLVLCFEVVEQLPNLKSGLDELQRVVRSDGLLLISAANRGVYPAGNPLHIQMLTSDELRKELSKRFSNVAVHRQCIYWASLLSSDSMLRNGDPSHRIEADVRKAVGGDPGDEQYAVAVATDATLPPAPSRLVLGDIVEYDEQRRLLRSWQDRALRSEMDASIVRLEMDFLRVGKEQASARAKAAEKALAQYQQWEPPQGWQAWTEELDLLQWLPRPVLARPCDLGSLGRDSYLIEPYEIDHPERVHMGNDVVVGERLSLTVGDSDLNDRAEIRIGDKVQIGSDAVINCPGGVEIAGRVGLSVRVTIGGEADGSSEQPDDQGTGPVRIDTEVIIGAGATIRGGVSIGRHAYVGAGAVVTQNVPPFSVVFGNPARVIRRWNEDTGKWSMGR